MWKNIQSEPLTDLLNAPTVQRSGSNYARLGMPQNSSWLNIERRRSIVRAPGPHCRFGSFPIQNTITL